MPGVDTDNLANKSSFLLTILRALKHQQVREPAIFLEDELEATVTTFWPVGSATEASGEKKEMSEQHETQNQGSLFGFTII